MTGLVVCLATLLAHATFYRFLTDDAFISFRYARNFADGNGLVFNPGFERVEGYTNFLWVLLLAGFDFLGLPPERMSHILTTALTVALFCLTAWFSGRSSLAPARTWIVLAAPLWLAATRSVAVWSTSGMETRLFETLLLAGVLAQIVEFERWRDRRSVGKPLAALLFGLAALTRPEGIAIGAAVQGCALVLVWRVAKDQVVTRAVVRRMLVWGLIVGGHFIFRRVYYESWLPNTYYAKVGGQTWWEMGAKYVAVFSLEYCAWVWLPLLAAAVAFHRRRNSGHIPILFAAAAVPAVIATMAIGGDHFEFRPLDLVFPFVFLLLADGLRHCSIPPRRAWVAPAAALTILVGIVWLPAETHRQFPEECLTAFPGASSEGIGSGYLAPARTVPAFFPPARAYVAAYRLLLGGVTAQYVGLRQEEHRLFLESMVPRAFRLRSLVAEGRLPADTHIAVDSVGAAPYFSNLRTLDRLGLTDAAVARRPPAAGPRIIAHEKRADQAYALEQGVDLWAALPATVIREVTARGFFRSEMFQRDGMENQVWIANLGDDVVLLAEFLKDPQQVRARMPRLDWRPLASNEVRRDLFDKAIRALQARLSRKPDDAETTLRLAEALLMSGDGARAIPLYVEAVRQRPGEVFPIESLAVAYYDQYQYDRAIAAMQAAIRLARGIGTPPLVAMLEQRLRGFETERDAERAGTPG